MARGRIADFRRSGFTERGIYALRLRALYFVFVYAATLLFRSVYRLHAPGALPSPSRVWL